MRKSGASGCSWCFSGSTSIAKSRQIRWATSKRCMRTSTTRKRWNPSCPSCRRLPGRAAVLRRSRSVCGPISTVARASTRSDGPRREVPLPVTPTEPERSMVEELLGSAIYDWIDLGYVRSTVRELTGAQPSELHAAAMKVVGTLIADGLVAAGDVTDGAFQEWDC